jgi:hypothetical protein
MLCWHRRLWLIDHGAALFFHHDWDGHLERSRRPFPLIRDHVLLERADSLARVDERLSGLFTPETLAAIVELIPDAWLAGETAFASPREHRAAYLAYLSSRLQSPRAFVEEALRARSAHV